MKRFANFYLCYDYKYDPKLRGFVRVESSEGYLLASGKNRSYKTKIRPCDLPEWYVYGYFYKKHGYMSAKGVKYLAYRPQKHWNHMFKDDFLFVSYNKPITHTDDTVMSFEGYDESIFGRVIIDFLLAAEKYSGYDITEIKKQIEDKRLWLKATFPDAYQAEVGRDEPFFAD